MKALRLFLICFLMVASAFSAGRRDEWYRGLDLETAAREAELIIVARVEKVTETQIVFGGKGESSMLQFAFKPVRVLKGVFARNDLKLTSGDLGGYRFGGQMREIKPGQMRLLFFRRSEVGYANSNSFVSQIDISMPPLADEHDPLLESVTALLTLQAEPDRSKRVSLLLSHLESSSGPSVIPLLEALRRRAFIATQNPATAKLITKFLPDESPSVRIAAAHALQAVLENDYLHSENLRETATTALLTALKRNDPNLAARDAVINAVGAVGPSQIDAKLLQIGSPGEALEITRAKLSAIGQLRLSAMAEPVRTYLGQCPLDAASDLDRSAEITLGALKPASLPDEILSRVQRKINAGLSFNDEISALENIEAGVAIPTLLKISALDLNRSEIETFARVCAQISKTASDDRLVPPLAQWLDPDLGQTRIHAVDVLLNIDTADAARALRPHLADEQNLARKLVIAQCLGRHAMPDGYAYAIEHMSEPQLLEAAVAALAAVHDARTVGDCQKILDTSHDVGWNAAAIRALGAVGAQEFAPKFLKIAGDFKNPLAPAALIALGDLHEKKAQAFLPEALSSRSDEVVIAAARAAGKLAPEDTVRTRLAALLEDSAASQSARGAALDALLALKDAHLDKALLAAVKDASLEQSELLERITKILRERKIALE